MFEIIVSSSRNSNDREIDEYHNSSLSGSSADNSSNSGGNTTNEQHTFEVPRVPLDVFQEEMRMRMASRSLAGTSTNVPLSHSSSEEETLYSCVVGIPSKIDEKKTYFP